MNNLFLAKTKPEETIQQHTIKLLKRMEQLKNIYPYIKYIDWDILELACAYHDMGKMNTKFQNKLYEKLGKNLLDDRVKNFNEIPHGYLSPAFLPKNKIIKKYGKDKYKILCQSIYYHHKRDELDNSDAIKATIEKELNEYRTAFNFEYIDKSEKLNIAYYNCVKNRFEYLNEDSIELYWQYVVIKGLLNKLDYAASAGIDAEIRNNDLYEKTIGYLKNEIKTKPNELQSYMIENQDSNNIIIGSTGIGKTEASLLWIGNNKGFFTLPLKVSINAIYDRVTDKIKFKDTALLHSDTFSQYLKRFDEVDTDYYEKTKQLSMPLTITTLDQIIDFIFKYEGYELKLATLSYSKLIIDEIQMYSPEMTAYLIMALKYITEAGGKFSIVTATFPGIIKYFMETENIKFNEPKIFYKKDQNGTTQLRHKIKVIDEEFNVKNIVENYKNKKVLVIVNTVKKAQGIYNELIKKLNGENINLLHSRFIKKDRNVKEESIFKMGQRECKEKGIWITTQIVEASLDIDFDVMYTELSDICGLFQRMGRVFRSRTLLNDITNVFVYLGGDKPTSGISSSDHSIVDIDIFNLSKKSIKKYDNMSLTEVDKMNIVSKVYSKENLENTEYFKKIQETINYVRNITEYDLEKNAVKLRDIKNTTVIPKSVYIDNKDNINELISEIQQIKNQIMNNHESSNNKKLRTDIAKRKDIIKNFFVDIPNYLYENIKSDGNIFDYLKIDEYDEINIVDAQYSFETGFYYERKKDKFDENKQFL